MIQYDTLWKVVLEPVFADFLRFFIPEADQEFNLKRGFQFLDKELPPLDPASQMTEAPKFVDKLVKVYRKSGKAHWLLIHVEIQGYRDPDITDRVHRYWYRILDKFKKCPETLVIYSDHNRKYKPAVFRFKGYFTKATLRFGTYKIIEQKEADSAKNDNPFAFVILTALLKLKARKLSEEHLGELKFNLLKQLTAKGYSKKQKQYLMFFLQNYVNFENPKYNRKFEKEMDTIITNDPEMGFKAHIIQIIEEQAWEKVRKEREKAIRKEREKAIRKEREELTRRLIETTEMNDKEVAQIAKTTIAFVRKLRKDAKK